MASYTWWRLDRYKLYTIQLMSTTYVCSMGGYKYRVTAAQFRLNDRWTNQSIIINVPTAINWWLPFIFTSIILIYSTSTSTWNRSITTMTTIKHKQISNDHTLGVGVDLFHSMHKMLQCIMSFEENIFTLQQNKITSQYIYRLHKYNNSNLARRFIECI